jgi:glycine dehydrogenase
MPALDPLAPLDDFPRRHIGPDASALAEMCAVLGVDSLEALIAQAVPAGIRTGRPLDLPPALGEGAALARLRTLADQNQVMRSLIGMGYHDCVTPPVIQRNILENPGWYTQYTPYQAEISQGRMEALVNFQTMVAELCGLPMANASLLDEATAAAEAMIMCRAVAGEGRTTFFVAEDCHPQTIAVVQTRAEPLGIVVQVAPIKSYNPEDTGIFGVLVQTPSTDGRLRPLVHLAGLVHGAGARLVVATDLLALTLTTPPGEMGADIAIGSTQRFGVPLGFGGPHAAFMAANDEFARVMPGRIVGVSRDAAGKPAYRLALQTREQHIRRERATSNICTAQVLLAVMASMYAVYHGPEGLKRIAQRVHHATLALAQGLRQLGFEVSSDALFDTLKVAVADPDALLARAEAKGINLRRFSSNHVGLSLDETVDAGLLDTLLAVFADGRPVPSARALAAEVRPGFAPELTRTSAFLTHPVFHQYHGEHAFLRYVRRLESRDLSLTTSMIPLGSCTMKLNATSEMLPVSWPTFARLHPFAPAHQTRGYQQLFAELEAWLADITGFAAVSLQPNAGSQGEYAGLLVIRAWQKARGQGHRNVCLIPTSAHGTNPASAAMCGMQVVAVACNDQGDVDIADLKAKALKYADRLCALMITYPSTHGVFEEGVREITGIVHEFGGQVYLDGANLNAAVGLVRPGELGADVCHLNLHKTFCIPHGGGGPGMGPIGVAAHLAPHLPGHPVTGGGGAQAIGPVSAAAYGSPGILPIPHTYISMMGAEGLTRATQMAIFNANYMATRLAPHYPVLFTGAQGRCAHEFILDCRGFKTAGITVDDIAKRLMDYGFHAPTMSFPVAGTLMIEPTESEPKAELDRLCDALIGIRNEIRAIEEGRSDKIDNPLHHAPHTAAAVTATEWPHRYTREEAAFPAPWVRQHKFWPPVARVDNAWGDRNLQCLCPPVEAFEQA